MKNVIIKLLLALVLIIFLITLILASRKYFFGDTKNIDKSHVTTLPVDDMLNDYAKENGISNPCYPLDGHDLFKKFEKMMQETHSDSEDILFIKGDYHGSVECKIGIVASIHYRSNVPPTNENWVGYMTRRNDVIEISWKQVDKFPLDLVWDKEETDRRDENLRRAIDELLNDEK